MVHELLGTGAETAITGKDLAVILGLKDTRELTRHIERERKDGFPICASTNSDTPGYYLAESPAEFERYIHFLNRRLKHVRATMESCQDTLLRMAGQTTAEGW